MKHPLHRFTIAVTGDFGESRGHDKMKQWITRNGGKFTTDISSKVTHLICSKEHYKKAVLMGMTDALFSPPRITQIISSVVNCA